MHTRMCSCVQNRELRPQVSRQKVSHDEDLKLYDNLASQVAQHDVMIAPIMRMGMLQRRVLYSSNHPHVIWSFCLLVCYKRPVDNGQNGRVA